MLKIVMRSCEDADTTYLCLGKRRYVFWRGMYMGWYKP